MPSNHSQFMSFLAVFVVWYLFSRVRAPALERIILTVSALFAVALICISRVYLGYHTGGQVMAGVIVGMCSGALWCKVYATLLEPIGPKVVALPWAKRLLLRDYSRIRNVSSFEWNVLHGDWNHLKMKKEQTE